MFDQYFLFLVHNAFGNLVETFQFIERNSKHHREISIVKTLKF